MRKNTSKTERRGVNTVERAILNLGWIFREQYVEDHGVDAQVELCDGDEPTGRVLALQIKTGPSYLSEETQHAFIYRGNLRHLQYWKNYSLPVILVLVDPETESAWWSGIMGNPTIEETRAGWKMEVPKSQLLNRSSLCALQELASGIQLSQARLADMANRFNTLPPGHSKLPLVFEAMQMAERTIDVVSPFIDERLLWVLALCSFRVRVRLITGPTQSERTIREYISGDRRDIEWRIILGKNQQLHTKLLLVDDFAFVTGSANLTVNSLRINDEYVFASSEQNDVMRARDMFESAWSSRWAEHLTFKLPLPT